MRVLGVAGHSGSGKTTLIARLIPALGRRGLRVSTIKHAHRHFDIDVPGKDSHRHREAGAHEVMVASASRWALLHEVRDGREPALPALLGQMATVDLVLVEGVLPGRYPKLEVFRADRGRAPLYLEDPDIVALVTDVTDHHADTVPLPVLGLDDIPAIAGFILSLGAPSAAAAPRPTASGA